jgi:hypothetical protein
MRIGDPRGLSALLVAAGFDRRSSDPCYPRKAVARGSMKDALEFAEGPSKIPAREWEDIFLRVYNGISEDRIFANAAGVTFYSLLALFPGITALVSIYGLFADPSTIVNHSISGFAPGGAIDLLRQQLTRLAAQGSSVLASSCVAYDNAMCESFFATLECELLERRRFTSRIEAKMACFSFIEGWYNPVRHSALGYRSPMAYEAAMEAVTREP